MTIAAARRPERPRRQVLPLALAAAAVAAGCRDITDPPLPPGAERFMPPAVYARWWDMARACTGANGRLAGVEWHVVPGTSQIPYGGGQVSGYWSAGSNRVVLAGEAQFDGPLVRHEMVHALLRTDGHARADFLGRCGGVVACDMECRVDAGPPPAPDPDAARVPPESLDVAVEVRPAPPGANVDGGFFTVTVTARNPAPRRVVVTFPGRTQGGVPVGFEYEARGDAGTVTSASPLVDAAGEAFAAGETKRRVYDFRVGPYDPGSAFPPGSYAFRGGFGGNWSAAVTAVVRP